MGKLQVGQTKGGEEETAASKGKRALTTVQIPRELDLRVTEYATRLGISKAEAMNRLFRAIYPGGVVEAPTTPIAPEEATAEPIAPGTEALSAPEAPSEAEEILTGVAKDLRTVNTIKQLNRAIKGDEKISVQDALELKKIESMFGDGGKGAPQGDRQARMMRSLYRRFQKETQALREEITKLREQDVAKERDFYRSKLEEREAEDKRQAELNPIYERLNALSTQIGEATKKTEREGEGRPVSPEQREALIALQKSTDALRLAIEKLGGEGGEKEKLSGLLDTVTIIIEKMTNLSQKLGGKPETPGELDWRTVAMSTAGEVATEAIKAYRDVETGKAAGKEDEGTQPLSGQVIERRVYNYAMKKIAAGELNVDPYKAADDLSLTPNQVWTAIENLRKRGALVAKTPAETGGTPPVPRSEEGIIEPPSP